MENQVVVKLVNKWQYVAPHLEDDFYLSCFIGADLPETVSSAGMPATFKGFYLGARSIGIRVKLAGMSCIRLAGMSCIRLAGSLLLVV
jgi:hypothetical protein